MNDYIELFNVLGFLVGAWALARWIIHLNLEENDKTTEKN